METTQDATPEPQSYVASLDARKHFEILTQGLQYPLSKEDLGICLN